MPAGRDLKSARGLALDIHRIVEHYEGPGETMGITRYGAALFNNLLGQDHGFQVHPVIYANPRDANLYELQKQLKRFQLQYDYAYAASWAEVKDRSSRIFHALETSAGRVIGRRATNFLADLFLTHRRVARLRARHHEERESLRAASAGLRNRVIHGWGRSGPPGPWNVYHSPYHVLPPRDLTGRATRIITIADVIYHLHRELYPARDTPYITKVLDSIDIPRDHVICMSDCTRRDVLSVLPLDPERVHTIPIAHDPLFHAPEPALCHPQLASSGIQPGRYVLALGQPNPRKNMVNLARAWQRIKQSGQVGDYGFIFIVPGVNRERFMANLTGGGVPPDLFTLIQDVDDRMLASFYHNAAAFGYVSKYEGFGLPPLEAMAAGCPVVVSRTDALVEVAGDAGEYVDPEDIDSIAEGLLHVLTNSERSQTLKRLGQARARQYHWDLTMERTLSLYERLLADQVHNGKRRG